MGQAPPLRQHRARLGDMQRFDHPSLVPLGAAGRRRDQPLRRLQLRSRSARRCGWRSRSGSDGSPTCRRSRSAALRAFRGEAVVRLEPVVDAVERGDSGGAGGEHDPLQRVGEARPRPARTARRDRRQRSLVPAISAALAGAIAAASITARGGLDHRQHRLAHQRTASCTSLALSALASTTKSAALCRTATTSSPKCAVARRVDPDRHRPAAKALPGRGDGGLARRRLVLLLHRILEIEHDHVGVERRALSRSRADWKRAGTAASGRGEGRSGPWRFRFCLIGAGLST